MIHHDILRTPSLVDCGLTITLILKKRRSG